MSKGVHNIAFYVSPDPECSRTTQNSEISLAPSRGRILYAIYGNSTCVINHIVVTAIDKKYRNYYVSTGNTYFATFLDDFSKTVVVIFLKAKSEFKHAFEIYKAWAEKQLNAQMKCLHSDRGGEYVNKDL